MTHRAIGPIRNSTRPDWPAAREAIFRRVYKAGKLPGLGEDEESGGKAFACCSLLLRAEAAVLQMNSEGAAELRSSAWENCLLR